MRYPFFDDGIHFGAKPIGHYELNHFPGCNQIVVSNHSCIYEEYRGNKLGQKLSEEKIARAKEEGFDYMKGL